eukprot:SM000107S14031  [mRNA]  locus=s107:79778:81230:- [translate_table: standard]
MSLLPTGPLASPRRAPNTHTGSKLWSSSSSWFHISSSKLWHLLMIGDDTAKVWDVEQAMDKSKFDVVIGTDVEDILSSIGGMGGEEEKFDAFLIHERSSDDELTSDFSLLPRRSPCYLGRICSQYNNLVTCRQHPVSMASSGSFINYRDTCQLVHQYEKDCNQSEVPIIGTSSAAVTKSALNRYAMSGYSAILEKPIDERIAGKWLRTT